MAIETGRLIEIYMGSFRNLEMYDGRDPLEPAVKDELERIEAILGSGTELPPGGENQAEAEIKYEDAASAISRLKTALNAHDGFGRERAGAGLDGIINGVNMPIFGREFSLEEKAAKLLYEVLKQHPFEDGNKRIGSFLFVYFLNINGCLYRENGDLRIDSNTLAALAILIAKSESSTNQGMRGKVMGLTAQLLNDRNVLLD